MTPAKGGKYNIARLPRRIKSLPRLVRSTRIHGFPLIKIMTTEYILLLLGRALTSLDSL